MTLRITRRNLLSTAAAAALPLAVPGALRAAAPMLGAATPPWRRFALGSFEVTSLLAATAMRPDPHSIFGLNVSDDEFASVSATAMLPTDAAQFFFTPMLVNTGEKLVLFDTGLNPEGITGALAAAGHTPDQIDLVVITHMHGDHIGGLRAGGSDTFANADYATGRVEFDAWSGMENAGFEEKVRPLAERMTMMEDGASLFSGHTAMAAFGHTPGHMAHLIESGNERLLIAVDFANHYVWSLAHPDWEVSFDMDKETAAVTRRRLLDMLAAEKMPFAGYHMPWPGTGFVEAAQGGYRYVPSSYQLML